MTSKQEQFYKRRISELEAQLRQRDERIATLEKQVAELLKAQGQAPVLKRTRWCLLKRHTHTAAAKPQQAS